MERVRLTTAISDWGSLAGTQGCHMGVQYNDLDDKLQSWFQRADTKTANEILEQSVCEWCVEMASAIECSVVECHRVSCT